MQPGRELSELPQYPAVSPGARIPLRGPSPPGATGKRQANNRNNGPAARQPVQAPSLHAFANVISNNCVIAELSVDANTRHYQGELEGLQNDPQVPKSS